MTPLMLGLGLGVIFGAAARSSKLCLLRGVKAVFGRAEISALRAFALALAVAILGTQSLLHLGLIELENSLPWRERVSWLGLGLGGAIFGVGSVMANACGGRSIVLAAGGNLRSLFVILVLGLAGQASQTGVLAVPRAYLQGLMPADLSAPYLPDLINIQGLPEGFVSIALTALVVLGLLAYAVPLLRSAKLEALGAAVAGAVIAAGWWAVYVSDDPFDPKVLTAVSYIAPLGESLMWGMLSTGREAGFAVGLVGGTLLGAFAMVLATRSFKFESFSSGWQALRFAAGSVLMAFGGVLALGCSIGQGLSGVSTLSLASLVAFGGIIAGIAGGLVLFRQP